MIGKLLKSTSPSRSSSHGSDINMGMTSPSSESHQSNGSSGEEASKKLTILHYNDVYNIDSQGIVIVLLLKLACMYQISSIYSQLNRSLLEVHHVFVQQLTLSSILILSYSFLAMHSIPRCKFLMLKKAKFDTV